MKRKKKGSFYGQPQNYVSQRTRRIRKKKIIFWSIVTFLISFTIFTSIYISTKPQTIPTDELEPQDTNELLLSKLSIDDLLEQSLYSELLRRCDIKIQENPYDPYWLKLRGIASYQIGTQNLSRNSQTEESLASIDSAIKDLSRTLVLDPKFEAELIYIFLGKAYYAKGHFFMDSSIYYFKKALEILESNKTIYTDSQAASNSRIVLYYLGSAYAEVAEYEKSISIFRQIEGENKSILHMDGSHYNAKNYLKAYETLQYIIENTSDTNLKNTCLNWKAKIYFEDGKYQEAIDIYESLVENFPNSPEPLYNIGMIHYKMNNKIKARAFFRNAATKEIPCPKANEALMSYF